MIVNKKKFVHEMFAKNHTKIIRTDLWSTLVPIIHTRIIEIFQFSFTNIEVIQESVYSIFFVFFVEVSIFGLS